MTTMTVADCLEAYERLQEWQREVQAMYDECNEHGYNYGEADEMSYELNENKAALLDALVEALRLRAVAEDMIARGQPDEEKVCHCGHDDCGAC